MSQKIIVIGSMNADIVIHSPKMPVVGETLTGSNFQVNAGGKGLNQAVAIAKLGGNVSFFGSVGSDSNGEMLIAELEKNGIEFRGIKAEGVSTGIAMITVVNGDNFIILNPGANEKLTPETISEFSALINESDFCVLQLEIPVETVLKICEIAKQGNSKIILNPAPYKELPDSLFSKIDYLIPNEHEACDLTGVFPDSEINIRKSIFSLVKRGVKNVIITLGERGCAYNIGDDVKIVPAIKTDVVDTTSAGDCFVGALVSKISQGETLQDSISFATKASSITVSREGASKSIPFANEI